MAISVLRSSETATLLAVAPEPAALVTVMVYSTTAPGIACGAEEPVGSLITAEVFASGQKIDVVGTSKGKGFAGVMKRHNFRGLGAGHGVQRKHRSPGSIGACATPGRVFKGVRMAGRMGNERVTVQNLTVHAIDAEKGLLLIKGAVPGPNGGLVLVKTAAKG